MNYRTLESCAKRYVSHEITSKNTNEFTFFVHLCVSMFMHQFTNKSLLITTICVHILTLRSPPLSHMNTLCRSPLSPCDAIAIKYSLKPIIIFTLTLDHKNTPWCSQLFLSGGCSLGRLKQLLPIKPHPSCHRARPRAYVAQHQSNHI